MKRTENRLDAKQVLSVIEKYSLVLDLLDDYDHQTMNRPSGNKAVLEIFIRVLAARMFIRL